MTGLLKQNLKFSDGVFNEVKKHFASNELKNDSESKEYLYNRIRGYKSEITKLKNTNKMTQSNFKKDALNLGLDKAEIKNETKTGVILFALIFSIVVNLTLFISFSGVYKEREQWIRKYDEQVKANAQKEATINNLINSNNK